eukprot:2641531-Rhodomonas_salina.1
MGRSAIQQRTPLGWHEDEGGGQGVCRGKRRGGGRGGRGGGGRGRGGRGERGKVGEYMTG